jgi:hypothetical protein
MQQEAPASFATADKGFRLRPWHLIASRMQSIQQHIENGRVYGVDEPQAYI